MSLPLRIALGGSSLLLLGAIGILLYTAADLRDFHNDSLKELDEWKVRPVVTFIPCFSTMKRKLGEK